MQLSLWRARQNRRNVCSLVIGDLYFVPMYSGKPEYDVVGRVEGITLLYPGDVIFQHDLQYTIKRKARELWPGETKSSPTKLLVWTVGYSRGSELTHPGHHYTHHFNLTDEVLWLGHETSGYAFRQNRKKELFAIERISDAAK